MDGTADMDKGGEAANYWFFVQYNAQRPSDHRMAADGNRQRNEKSGARPLANRRIADQYWINTGSIRAHVILLADFHAVVAQDVVGGRHVEEELRQRVVQQIVLAV